jgi:hypothetical protein
MIHPSVAARRATGCVLALRDPGTALVARHGDDAAMVDEMRAMLADMLSTGADR